MDNVFTTRIEHAGRYLTYSSVARLRVDRGGTRTYVPYKIYNNVIIAHRRTLGPYKCSTLTVAVRPLGARDYRGIIHTIAFVDDVSPSRPETERARISKNFVNRYYR